MWEAIEHVLMSPSSTSFLTFMGLALVGAMVLIKTGLLEVHTSAVQIGAADVERDIIRQQLEYARLHLQDAESTLPKPENYDDIRGKYILEIIYDEYVNWVTFNHINKAPTYIKLKQERLIAIVHHNTVLPFFKTEEFDEYIREDTEKLIHALIEIRELYQKKGVMK